MAGCTPSTRRARKPLEEGPRPYLQDELIQRMTWCPAFTRIGATHYFIEGVNQRMMGRSLLHSSNTPARLLPGSSNTRYGVFLGRSAYTVALAQAPSRHNSGAPYRSEEHTSELQSPCNLVC